MERTMWDRMSASRSLILWAMEARAVKHSTWKQSPVNTSPHIYHSIPSLCISSRPTCFSSFCIHQIRLKLPSEYSFLQSCPPGWYDSRSVSNPMIWQIRTERNIFCTGGLIWREVKPVHCWDLSVSREPSNV